MNRLSRKTYIVLVALTLILTSAINCLEDMPEVPESPKSDIAVPKPDTKQPATEPSGNKPIVQKMFQDTVGHKIDYSNPKSFLAPGTQSSLSEQYAIDIFKQIKIGSNEMENIGAIFKWKQGYFKASAAGGKLIGKVTVNQLVETKALSGCHDHGLVLVTLFRNYKFPAIMVDATGIQWAMDYATGKETGFKGHIFVEVYVNDKWILINSTNGQYIENYDPCNPVIAMPDSADSKGYYVLFKGVDPAGYGISSNEQLTGNMKSFAAKVNSTDMSFPQYSIKKLP
jgi:hypothetical protein